MTIWPMTLCIGISGLQQVGTPGVVWLFDDDDDDGELFKIELWKQIDIEKDNLN